MGQCRTLDANVTIGCYYGDYSTCDNTIPTSLFILNKFFSLTFVKTHCPRWLLSWRISYYDTSWVHM